MFKVVVYLLLAFLLSTVASVPLPRLHISSEVPPSRVLTLMGDDSASYITDLVSRCHLFMYGSTVPFSMHCDHLHIQFRNQSENIGGAWRDEGAHACYIEISNDYINTYAGSDGAALTEMSGMLVHEIVHILQNGEGIPSGLTEGIADYVRAELGFGEFVTAVDASKPWDDGYVHTASFLHYLDTRFPGKVMELNARLGDQGASAMGFVFDSDPEIMYRDFIESLDRK